MRPVFWIRMIGFWPPVERPAATENARPSRLTGTSGSDGSACMSWYRQFVSLSGSHTTWVTPFFFISPSTISGLSSAFCVWVMGRETSTALVGARPSRRIPGRPATSLSEKPG